MSDFDLLIVGGGIAGASLGAEVAAARRTLIAEAEAHCGVHATGRSAAFWLESYGGPRVAELSAASRDDLAAGGYLHQRGAVHLSDDQWPEIPVGIECRRLTRAEIEALVPGVRPRWQRALLEPGCADIDVAALHAAFLARFRRDGGTLAVGSPVSGARRSGGRWIVNLRDGQTVSAAVIVNAAGAWADEIARLCGAKPLGIAPKRRTMVQLRVARHGIRETPLVGDAAGTFYFKGSGDQSLWLSPHDEIETDPCDAAPEEIDVATAIDRFEQVVDWPVERVERRWAGLRSFAPDRLPVYGYEPDTAGFFWCAGQGGFGIQTSPAAAKLAAGLLLDTPPDPSVAHIAPESFSPARFDLALKPVG